MAQGISDMLMLLPLLYLMNQIDWTQEQNIMYVRLAYAGSHVGCFLLWAYLYMKISASTNNRQKIRIPVTGGFGTTSGAVEETTVCEYDLAQVKKAINQMALSVVIVGAIHYKWEFVQPLFMQAFMVPMQLYKNPLVKIYLLGERGAIEQRPFKEESPFGGMFPQPPAPQAEEPARTPARKSASSTTTTEVVEDDDDDNAPRVQELPDDTDVVEETKKSRKSKKNK